MNQVMASAFSLLIFELSHSALDEMVEPKEKLLAPVLAKSHITQNSAENPSNIVNSDISVEDSWVVVKKQRINILIPPLPTTEPCTSMLDPEQAKVCLTERNDVSLSVSPKTNIVSTQEVTAPPSKPSPRKMNNKERTADLRNFHKEKTRAIHKCCFHLITRTTTFRDKMMKASNLERRIVRAGGVDKWLSSLGLDEFTMIFRGKKISKFQLANLSMKKLKDMGAHAVGPRRKLIHAIECAILF